MAEKLDIRKALHNEDRGRYYASRLALAMWLPATCFVCGHEFTVDSLIDRDARLEKWDYNNKPILRCADEHHDKD